MNQHQIIGLKTEKLWWNGWKTVTHKRTLIEIHTKQKFIVNIKFWSWRRLTISMCIAYWCVLGVVWNCFPFFFRNIAYIDFSLSLQNIYLVLMGFFFHVKKIKKNITSITCLFFSRCIYVCRYLEFDGDIFLQNAVKKNSFFFLSRKSTLIVALY